jgi:hypothetical protein
MFAPNALTQMITGITTTPDSAHLRGNLSAYQNFYTFYARLLTLKMVLDAFRDLVIIPREAHDQTTEELP